MKWFAGLGKQLTGVFATSPDTASSRRHRERVVARGLSRLSGHSPDKRALQEVLANQAAFDRAYRRFQESGAVVEVPVDGIDHLQPLWSAQRGYVLVHVQGFVTSALRHLARTPRARPVAHVVFQPHEDPAAHLAVLERGHGLAFEMAFFPQHSEDDALLCEFLGEVTALSLKAARFAVTAGAPVFPVWGRREGKDGLRLEIAPPLDPGASPVQLAEALLHHFESRIHASPADMDWEADCWYPPTSRLLPSRFSWSAAPALHGALRALRPFRVLVRTPDSVRESCLTVPAVRALKRGRPDVHLTVLTRSSMHAFWERLPECDACLGLEDSELQNDQVSYDLGVLLNRHKQAAAELTSKPVWRTVGMETHPLAAQLDEALKMPRKLGPPEHRHRTYLRVAHRLGAEVVHDPRLRSAITPRPAGNTSGKTHSQPAGAAPSKQGKRGKRRPPKKAAIPTTVTVLGLAPGSDEGPSYAWPQERFMEVIRASVQEGRRHQWRVFLKPDTDWEPWETLTSEMGDQRVKLIQDGPGLAQRLDALADCRLVVANDNDLLHLAATVHGIPTIAIYGPSEPIETAPVAERALTLRRHVECTPCFLAECPLDHRCLEEIPVDEVLEALNVALPIAEPSERGS